MSGELRLEIPARAEGLAITPTLPELATLASDYRQASLAHTWIADCETPVSAFLKLRDGQPAFLLESTEEGQRLGRYSIVGIRPQAILRARGERLWLRWPDGTERDFDPADPFGAVEDVVRSVAMAPAPPGLDLAFWGGAVGVFGYDLVRRVERLPAVPPDDRGLDDLVALVTGPLIVFDHLRRSLTIVVPCPLPAPGEDPAPAYRAAAATIAELKERLAAAIPPAPASAGTPGVSDVRSNVAREDFEAAVQRARDYIFAGDAFQIVPSQRFAADVAMDPFSLYRGLRTVNPSPYMFFIEDGPLALAGSSPETLVKVEGRHVEMHPIAGSRPRGATPDEDRRLAEELLADPKERAEHVMLVDLGRNDLGRVCTIGSVRVKELMAIGRYSHIMHIESTVVGELAEGRRATDALRATFPAGTLSGAPKVRAMEIIDELEPTKRGPYGGAVGYLGYDGDLDTCITIRTLICHAGRVYVQAGAGIVADSVPATEHEETQNKARGMFRAIEVAAQQPGW